MLPKLFLFFFLKKKRTLLSVSQGFVKLTESEIQDRLSVTVSRRLKKIENQKKREKMKLQQAVARQMIENKMKQKMEQQGWMLLKKILTVFQMMSVQKHLYVS